MLVPGAMAATSAAMVIITPAEAARAPLGDTKTTTGTLLASMFWTIKRIDSANPPGVSSSMMMQAAPCSSAVLIPDFINSVVPGLMASAIRII